MIKKVPVLPDNIFPRFVQPKALPCIIFFLCLLAIASVPRLLSLDAHWSSDETLWLDRSTKFMSAVENGDFSETLITYHPGVTTMWISGLRTFFIQQSVNLENLTYARWFIGICVLAGIGIVFLLIYKLFGQWVALASLVSLAYSPRFLAETRRVHTDALAVLFILLSVLLFLLYCQNRQRPSYLILSGLAFGLSVLSKSYALIILLWIPLCLLLSREKRIGGNLWVCLAEGICFLNATALTVLALWPVFWTLPFGILSVCLFLSVFFLSVDLKKRKHLVKSLSFWGSTVVIIAVWTRVLQTVWNVFDRVNWAITTPHEVEHFFLGQVVNDPGWLFYPFVLTLKSTPLMLPLALFGCILLWGNGNPLLRLPTSFGWHCLWLRVLCFSRCVCLQQAKN